MTGGVRWAPQKQLTPTYPTVSRQPLRARQRPHMPPHLLERLPSSKTGGARPLDVEEACRQFAITTGSHISAAARRTRSRPSTSPASAGFPTRSSTRGISRLATHLRDRLGVIRGDRVAVLALNTTDTLEVQFACFRIGAVFLPLNTRLTVPELQFIVGDASPKVMIHDTRSRRGRALGRKALQRFVRAAARR